MSKHLKMLRFLLSLQNASPRPQPENTSFRYVTQGAIFPSPNSIVCSQSNEHLSNSQPVQVSPHTPQSHSQRHSDPLGGLGSKDKMLNFGDLAKTTPPFKDFFNNLHTYQYIQQLEQQASSNANTIMQPRHSQITQQYSSSTDEGCETDHDHGTKERDESCRGITNLLIF